MGGRGKGVTAAGEASAFVNVDVSFNPDSSTRPYVFAGAWDKERWHEDARGRPRTFATKEAITAFAQSHASGPVAIRFFDRTAPT